MALIGIVVNKYWRDRASVLFAADADLIDLYKKKNVKEQRKKNFLNFLLCARVRI